MKRKILSLILVFAMTVSLLTVGTGAVEPTYGDTAGHWAESSIERWSAYGIIQGSNGLFDPNGQLTCAQLATILAKLLKLPAAKDAGFTDNTADAWYYDAINRCAAAGILNGNGDGTVTPEAPISRERAMVMLARALGIEPLRKPDLTKYTDAAQVSAYAQGYVAALIEAGIVGGVTADELAPQDNITRAATVTILDRAISTYADKAGATVKADGKGIVLVVAENVKITGAPEGTKIVVADGATGLTVNGKAVSDDQTYIVPKTTTSSGSSSSGGHSHTHTWGDWTTTKAATCAETGTRTRTCAGCGQVETAAIVKLAHAPGTAATCTTAQFCTVCGEKLADALGHDYQGAITTEATCAVVGVKTFTCTRCRDSYTESIDKTDHTWGDWTEIESTCTGKTLKRTCTVCYTEELKTENAVGHREIAMPDVAATCTTDGSTGGKKCSDCNAIIEQPTIIPATGHSFSDEWTEDEENHWHKCANCDAYKDKAAHNYSVPVTDWADSSLKTSKTCAVCSKTVDLAGENTYYIATVADLKAFAAKVNDGNNFSGKTVKLTADIDLKDVEWTPIGNVISYPGTTFKGTFDGQEHTISNMTVNDKAAGYASAGFFGSITGQVKNVKFDNATVTSTHYAGVVVGYSSTNVGMEISNCHVANSSVTSITELTAEGNYDNGDKAGGIIGYCVSGDTVTNCSVTNTTVKGYRDIGGLIGYADNGAVITNNTVKDSTIINDRSNNYKNYTKDAEYDINAIVGDYNGTLDDSNTATNVTVKVDLSDGFCKILGTESWYEISNLVGLTTFATSVNSGTSYANEAVKLTADIDLENKEWTPIGKSGSTFQGTFDGQGHTISNLKTGSSQQSDVGLFGFTTNGEVKNFTLQNADVTGYLDVGAIAGTPYTSKYTNITLCGKITVNGYAYVGGAFGKNAYADLTNITINVESGSYVKADSKNYRTYVGGLVGFMGEGSHVVKDVTSNIDVIGSTCDVGGITGIAHYGNTFENCSSSGNVTLVNARYEGNHLEIGGIAGVWHDETKYKVTFKKCDFTGQLSTKLNGVDKTSELSELHRIVGRRYGAGTGSLIIDGATQVLAATQGDLNDIISKATAEEKISVNLTTAGTYALPSLANKSITISGTKDTVIDMENKLNNGASNISFEGVTVKFGTNDYKGFQHTGKLTYKDCTITGKQFLYGTEVEFINCSFMQDVVDYNVWTYGAGKVLFKDCKFNCKGKSVLIYNEGALKAQTVEFQNCSFNASVKADGKAAIEIDSRFTSYTVTIDQATANNVIGFANGSVSNNSLWNVKAHTKPVTVTVDSTVMYNQ